MASVGAAAASGLETGLGLGMRMRAQEQQEEQLKRSNLIQDEQLQRQRDADKRLEDDRALDAINKAFDDLRAEGEGYVAQYGKAVPEDVAGDYKRRVGEVSGARNDMLRKRYAPIVEQRQQRARDIAMQLQAGKLDIDQVPAADLYDAIHVQTRRDPADLIGKDGKPSRVSSAVADIMDGLEYKNEGAVLRGANVLLEPELKVGVGELSPHGGTIVGKQIVKLIPHPADPNKVLPVLKVYVKRGKPGDQATPIAAEEGAPPGATGYYIAPLTENRTSDPNDPPKAVDLQQALEYASQMQTLSTVLAHPTIAKKLEEGKAAAGGDFLSAFYAVRGKMPAKAPVEYKTVKPGERLVGIDTATGKPTGQDIEGPAKPVAPAKTTGLAAQIQAVQDYADEKGITEAEAAIQLQQQGLLRAPKGVKGARGGGGGSGGGLARPSAASDLTGEEFLKTLSADDARIVKGLADGTIKPESISTKGNRREHMLAMASQYNPEAGTGGKPLPQAVLKQISEVRDNAATITRLANGFDDSFAGKGLFGLGADKQLQASGILGTDKKSVQWWKDYRKGAELVERHAMFGAALSAGEQASWRSADIDPGMDAGVIKDNLATRAKLAKKMLEATRQDLIDAGHSEKRVRAIADRDMSIEQPQDTPQRKSGFVEAPTPSTGATFRLPSDPKAAAAAYARLPAGSKYIDPDGNPRTKR